jgi:excisionase family DNA binding protein
VNNRQARPSNPLLTPAEVAAAFRVDPKTVTRWAKAGKLNFIRTLGGHRRYLEADVIAIISGGLGSGSWPTVSSQLEANQSQIVA